MTPERFGRALTSSITRLSERPLLAFGRQAQFRPGEGGDELVGVLKLQLRADILAGAGVGGGGDGQARDPGEELGQAAQHAVFGAEVVAPLADAVGLVDGDQGDLLAGEAVQVAGCIRPSGDR